MITYKRFLIENILGNVAYGINEPDFTDGQIGTDSSQDFLMKFFGIKRDFHYTFFKQNNVYIMVGLGVREGLKTHRLVFGLSKTPTSNWKKYKYHKQGGVSVSTGQMYSRITSIAINMIETVQAERVALNGYTPKLTKIFKKMFATPKIQSELDRAGFKASFKDEWIYLDKVKDGT